MTADGTPLFNDVLIGCFETCHYTINLMKLAYEPYSDARKTRSTVLPVNSLSLADFNTCHGCFSPILLLWLQPQGWSSRNSRLRFWYVTSAMLQFSRFHFIISCYEVPQNWHASGRGYQQLAEVKLLLTALTNQSLTSIRVPDFPCWISRLIPFRGIKVDSVDCQIFTLLRMIK